LTGTGTPSGTSNFPLSLNHSAMSFGNVQVGASSELLAVSLWNLDPNAELLGLTSNSPLAADFEPVNPNLPLNQPISVSPDPTTSSLRFQFLFVPSTLGEESATYSIQTTDGDLTVALSGTGTGTTAPPTLAHSSISFGNVVVGAQATPLSVGLWNQDPNNQLLGVTSNSPLAADFPLLSPNPLPLNQPLAVANLGSGSMSGSLSLQFGFNPSTSGAESATYTIQTSDGDVTLTLSGNGISPITLNHSSISFGNVQPGTPATPLAAALWNLDPNNQLLGVTSNSPLAADFPLLSPNPLPLNQPIPVASLTQQSMTFQFGFNPSTSGAESATYTIETSDGDVTVILSGDETSGGSTSLVGLASPNLDFGSVTVGTASPSVRTTAILNQDPNNVLLSATADGPNAADFTLVSGPAVGQPLTTTPPPLRFSFNPTVIGPEAATYTLNTSDGPLTVTLTGTGSSNLPANPISLNHSSISFGSVEAGTSAEPLSVGLWNFDPNNQLLGVTSDSPLAADFPLLSPNPLPLNQPIPVASLTSSSLSLQFGFNPSTVGAESATYTIETSDGNLTLTLSGSGTSPLSLNHSAMSFGNVQVGTASELLAVSLWNLDPNAELLGLTSNSPLAADFEPVNPNLPLNQPIPVSLDPTTSSLRFQFLFVPSTIGAESATYTIETSDGDMTVILSGAGVTAPPTLAHSSMSFGNEVVGTLESPMSVGLWNQDPNNQLLGVTSDSPLAADFPLLSPNPLPLNQPLAVANLGSGSTSGSLSLQFGFDPSTVGAESATYTIRTSDGDVTVTLSGDGTSPITLSHSSLSFGNVVAGTLASPLPVGLWNLDPNNQLLGVTSDSPLAADFPLLNPNPLPLNQPIPLAISPTSSSLSFQFGFNPSTIGDESATYTIETSNGDLSITLSGTGTSPISLSRSSLDFGSSSVGTPTTPLTVGLWNFGQNVELLAVTSNSPLAGDFPILNSLPLAQPVAAGFAGSPSLSLQFAFVPSQTALETATYTVETSAGNLTLTLSGNSTPTFVTTSLPDADVGTAYSQAVATIGGDGDNSFTVSSGTLPAWLSLNTSTGMLSGTPAAGDVGTVAFTLSVTDSLGSSASQPFSFTVNPAVSLGALSFAQWTVNQGAYTGAISVAGGSGAYSNLTVTGLPTGLSASLTGGAIEISGTPTSAPGTYPITASLQDSSGSTDSQTYTFTVDPSTTLAWTGIGGDNLWTDALNWSGAAPVRGDTLIFGAGALQRTTSFNNFAANTAFTSILFQDSGYSISGNTIKLSGGVDASNSVVGTNTLALNVVLTANQTFIVDGPSDLLQLSGVLSGGPGLTKAGAGTLDLTGSSANTYTGTTTVSSGLLQLDKSVANAVRALVIDAGASATLVGHDDQINDGATVTVDGSLDLAGHSDAIGTLVLSDGSVTTGSGTLVLGGNLTSTGVSFVSGNLDLGGATRTVNVASGTATISAVISNGGLTKRGSGTLVLSGANSYATGTTTVSAGILSLQNSSALGSTAVSVSGGATVQIQGGLTINQDAILRGAGLNASGALQSVDGSNTWAGAVTLATNSVIAVDAGQLTLSGLVSGSGGLTKTGTGTLVLAGSNTYTGATAINGGSVLASNASGIAAGAVTVNSSGTLGGNGRVGTVRVNTGGTLAPGSGTTAILSAGNVAMTSGSNFNVTVNGSSAGTEYDQLNATGTVNLGGATLNVSVGTGSMVGDTYTIIKNVKAVVGSFAGLAEGATFTAGSAVFRITYHGGAGNDVVLNRIA
jgi:autotransporter-associated beta strand protein